MGQDSDAANGSRDEATGARARAMSGDVYRKPVTVELGGPGKPIPSWMMAPVNRCMGILRALPEPRRDNLLQVTRILVTNAFAACEWPSIEERAATLQLLHDCVASDLERWDRKLASVAP